MRCQKSGDLKGWPNFRVCAGWELGECKNIGAMFQPLTGSLNSERGFCCGLLTKGHLHLATCIAIISRVMSAGKRLVM